MIEKSVSTGLPVCDHYAGSERTIVKSLSIQNDKGPVFDVTLDFEDGAAYSQSLQRELIGHYLNSSDNRFGRVGIRINALDTNDWQGDVDAVIKENAQLPAYINLPKAEDPQALKIFSDYLKRRLVSTGHRKAVPLHIMVESPCGLLNLERMLRSTPIECVSFGLLDYISSFGGAVPSECMNSPGQFEHSLLMYAKQQVSMLCHAFKITPSHSITIKINDKKQVYDDAKRAREEFGFLRMWSIHSNQIESILEAFSYSDEEIEKSLEILQKAQASGWVPLSHGDCMHDIASYRMHVMKLGRAFNADCELTGEINAVLKSWNEMITR